MTSQPVIGFAINNTRESAWAYMEQGAVDRAQQLGLELSVVSAITRAEQSAIIQQFIQQRVAALIVASLGDVRPDCEAAHAAGIPVVTCEVGNSERYPAVACDVRQDLRQGAQQVTRYLAEAQGGQGKILHLTAPNSPLRTLGFHETLADYPAIEVAECVGDWSLTGSMSPVRAALLAHPDTQAVFAHNDTMALAAVAVAEELGRSGQIRIAGVDAIPLAIRALYEGKMAATVDILSDITGRVAIETVQRVLHGETVPVFIDTPVRLINRDNLTSAAVEKLIMLPQLIHALANSNFAQRQLQAETIAFQNSVIQELSTPIIPISDAILVMPLIGSIDSNRAEGIMRTILAAIEQSDAKVLILDITGIRLMDTAVANYLMRSAQAAQLLGVRVMLVGIKPEVAQTIVQLGIDLSSMVTQSTLQFGLEYANRYLVKSV